MFLPPLRVHAQGSRGRPGSSLDHLGQVLGRRIMDGTEENKNELEPSRHLDTVRCHTQLQK